MKKPTTPTKAARAFAVLREFVADVTACYRGEELAQEWPDLACTFAKARDVLATEDDTPALPADVLDALRAWHAADLDGGMSHADLRTTAAEKLTRVAVRYCHRWTDV